MSYIPAVLCSHCRHDNHDDARFCANCGTRLSATQPPPAADEAMATQIVTRPPRTTEPPRPEAVPEAQPWSVPPPPRRRGTRPIVAAALGLGGGALGALLGFVLFTSADEGGSQRQVAAEPTAIATAATPAASPTPARAVTPSPTLGPVRGPGYKLTATFTEPPNLATPLPFDRRVFDAVIVGVNWEDAARLYGRRYPLNFLWNITTTNLLLQPHRPEDARRLLTNAGYPTAGPKIHLAANPSDRVFQMWLTEQLRALGMIVVTDPNQFTAEDRANGYYGIIIDVIPA